MVGGYIIGIRLQESSARFVAVVDSKYTCNWTDHLVVL